MVVAASAVAHLAKGLDFEEATVHLVLLVALLRARRQFVAPGDPATILPLAQVGLALARLPAAPRRCYAYDHDAFSERIEDALLIVIGGLAFRGALALVPAAPRRGRPRRTTASARRRSCRSTGSDSLAYFALRRDKSYFFSPSGRSFLAYRVDRRHGARRRRPDRRRRRARTS